MAHVMRIAYFSPLPPERSGISDYSAELLPHLAQRASLTLFAGQPEEVSDSIRAQHPILSLEDYPRLRWSYDIPLYQMGNSRYHKGIYSMLLRYPGITVLHEYSLHHLILERTIADSGKFGYTREMGYENGVPGVKQAVCVQQGRAIPSFFQTPLNARTLDHSLGLIVHSHFTAAQIRARRPELPMAVVPAPIRSEWGRLLSRQELGCPKDALVFASAGMVTRHKQIPMALEAFSLLAEHVPNAVFVVIGSEPGADNGEEPPAQPELAQWLAEHHLQDRIIRTGYVPDLDHFVSWIAAADVLLNLRHPTLGETSATALRGLAAGRPVIVSHTGWYAELPDDVCVKVAPDDLDGLVAEMRRLAADPAARREIGDRARLYAETEHNPARVAQKYVRFIEDVIAARLGRLRSPAPLAEPAGGIVP
jgi:glycosyltransferase involved in cell wall biosynthesis